MIIEAGSAPAAGRGGPEKKGARGVTRAFLALLHESARIAGDVQTAEANPSTHGDPRHAASISRASTADASGTATRTGDRRRPEEQAAIPGNDRALTATRRQSAGRVVGFHGSPGDRTLGAPRPPSDLVQIDPSGSAESVKLRAPASRREIPRADEEPNPQGQETKGGLPS